MAKPRGWIYGAKWGNVPVEARVCLATVGIAPPNWWCHELTGSERRVIEVKMPDSPDQKGQTVYIDNQDGWSLDVFLRGLAPLPRFRFLPVFFLKDDPEAAQSYHAKFEGIHL